MKAIIKFRPAAAAMKDMEALERKIFMVANINQYLTPLYAAAYRHESGAIERASGEKHILRMAVSLLQQIDYSPELKKIAQKIRDKTVKEIYKNFRDEDAVLGFGKMNREQRETWFFAINRLYFDEARKFFPQLKDAVVNIRDMYNYGGIDDPTIPSLKTGDTGPLYLGQAHFLEDNFYQVHDTYFHEAYHHTIVQLASLHLRGMISLSPALKRDAQIIIEFARHEFSIHPNLEDIYNNFCDEKLAAQCGAAAQKQLRNLFKTSVDSIVKPAVKVVPAKAPQPIAA